MSAWRAQSLSYVLRVLADSSMVEDDDDKRTIHSAADAVDRSFATFDRAPTVLVTGGYDADPITLTVAEMADDIDRLLDDLSTFGDRIDEVKRLLKKAGTAEVVGAS